MCRSKNHYQSICWKCFNSDKNGCDWVKSFKKINGWKVLIKKVSQVKEKQEVRIIVLKCPEFLSENEMKKNVLNEELRQEIFSMFDKKLNIYEIAKKLNLNQKIINEIIRERIGTYD